MVDGRVPRAISSRFVPDRNLTWYAAFLGARAACLLVVDRLRMSAARP